MAQRVLEGGKHVRAILLQLFLGLIAEAGKALSLPLRLQSKLGDIRGAWGNACGDQLYKERVDVW